MKGRSTIERERRIRNMKEKGEEEEVKEES